MLQPMNGDALLSRAEVRELDRRAIEELGIPGAVLMENAGRQAAEHLLAALRVQSLAGRRGVPPWRIAIVCGRGNNGGDGYVVARHAFNAGHEIECFSTVAASELAGDAALNRAIVERMGLAVTSIATSDELARTAQRWSSFDALVDGVLGTGASGAPRTELATVIEAFNAAQGPLKLALDLPSGLDTDSGEAPGACVKADLTVTFVARKLGFANEASAAWTGAVFVADIGVGLRSIDPRTVRSV